MPLKLLPVVPADAAAMNIVFFTAFYPQDPFETLKYPSGATPLAMEWEYSSIVRNLEDPNTIHMKVIDTEIAPDANSNEMVAWIRWQVYKHERPPEEWDAYWSPELPDLSTAQDGVVNDVNILFERVFSKKSGAMRKRYIQGKPHMFMERICTRSRDLRRGAAAMLLNWGADLADREGLDIYASPSPWIISTGAASNLGFDVLEAWYLDPVKDLGRSIPTAHQWPLRKTFIRRSPSRWL